MDFWTVFFSPVFTKINTKKCHSSTWLIRCLNYITGSDRMPSPNHIAGSVVACMCSCIQCRHLPEGYGHNQVRGHPGSHKGHHMESEFTSEGIPSSPEEVHTFITSEKHVM